LALAHAHDSPIAALRLGGRWWKAERFEETGAEAVAACAVPLQELPRLLGQSRELVPVEEVREELTGELLLCPRRWPLVFLPDVLGALEQLKVRQKVPDPAAFGDIIGR
jgi:hypothetical protein